MKKQYRVKKNEEISKILNNKEYFVNAYFSVYKKRNFETTNFRYAISVGKKIGNAVVRNRIKRQIRAILSEINIDINLNFDVLIIARIKVLQLSYHEMKKQLEYLFNKQKLIAKGDKND